MRAVKPDKEEEWGTGLTGLLTSTIRYTDIVTFSKCNANVLDKISRLKTGMLTSNKLTVAHDD